MFYAFWEDFSVFFFPIFKLAYQKKNPKNKKTHTHTKKRKSWGSWFEQTWVCTTSECFNTQVKKLFCPNCFFLNSLFIWMLKNLHLPHQMWSILPWGIIIWKNLEFKLPENTLKKVSSFLVQWLLRRRFLMIFLYLIVCWNVDPSHPLPTSFFDPIVPPGILILTNVNLHYMMMLLHILSLKSFWEDCSIYFFIYLFIPK